MIALVLLGCIRFDSDVFVEEFDRLSCERVARCNELENDTGASVDCASYPEPADPSCFDADVASQCLIGLRTAQCGEAESAEQPVPLLLPPACGCVYPCNRPSECASAFE